GLYLAVRYGARELLGLLAAALGTAAALSVAFALALPAHGIDHEVHLGAWRGVFPQKNGLGQTMALGTLAFLLLSLRAEGRRWIAWSGAALCASLVLLSTSKTALAVLLTCLALLPL